MSNENEKLRVLVLDDDKHLLPAITLFLTGQGFDVISVSSVPKAMNALETCGSVDVAIIDKGAWNDDGEIGHREGLDVAKEIKEQHPYAIVIVYSGEAALNDAIRATGADYFVVKPIPDVNIFVRLLRGEPVQGEGIFSLH